MSGASGPKPSVDPVRWQPHLGQSRCRSGRLSSRSFRCRATHRRLSSSTPTAHCGPDWSTAASCASAWCRHGGRPDHRTPARDDGHPRRPAADLHQPGRPAVNGPRHRAHRGAGRRGRLQAAELLLERRRNAGRHNPISPSRPPSSPMRTSRAPIIEARGDGGLFRRDPDGTVHAAGESVLRQRPEPRRWTARRWCSPKPRAGD